MGLPAPLVQIEADGESVEFDAYIVCSFSPTENICHFRRYYNKEDTKLIDFMKNKNWVTLTLFDDPQGAIPRIRISGAASFFILSNTISRPDGVIEDLLIEGTIEYL